MRYCSYYQANVNRKDTLFFVATLRFHEHVAFDRTLDKVHGVFEFFVPPDQERKFEKIMEWYEQKGIISHFKKLPNRLQNSPENF